MKNFNCDDIKQCLQYGVRLLDVRSTEEYNKGSLPRAVNIPLPILPTLAEEHLEYEEPIFVYCQSGGRAMMAEKILRSMGFQNILNIGGMLNYQPCH